MWERSEDFAKGGGRTPHAEFSIVISLISFFFTVENITSKHNSS